ncbi:porin [Escherichia coli]|nr:porin [Escherichia coli]ELC8119507.1 porin [Escherichia coli]EMA2754234.1 porin [Escherichia coli]MBB7084191.1 porin [Escherichia coli]HBN7445654.1 porin [Escherichia coli]
MKKVTVAIAASILMGATAQAAEVYNKDGNKLDFYGRAVGAQYLSVDKNNDGDQSYARVGFKGETQINDQLAGFGQWEHQFGATGTESEGTKNWARLAFAGLKFGEFGTVDYGRNYGILYDVVGYTDMLPEFGGDTLVQTDVYMTGRTSGVATYRNTDFFGLVDGLNFAVQYQGKAERTALEQSRGDGVGASLSYEYEGFSVSGAYSNSDRTNDQILNAPLLGANAEAWAAGLKYDANNVYLAATYSEANNMNYYGSQKNIANKTQNLEIVAQYQFDFGLRPSVAYLQSKGKDLGTAADGKGGDHDLVKYVELGATYSFNKNMMAFVDYKINLLDKKDEFAKTNQLQTDDIVALGLIYQF